jgi:hypothetical protein
MIKSGNSNDIQIEDDKRTSPKKSPGKKKFLDTDDEDSFEEEKLEDSDDSKIYLKKTILEGSFLPAVTLLHRQAIDVEDIIEEG